jgi:hypothetical protein
VTSKNAAFCNLPHNQLNVYLSVVHLDWTSRNWARKYILCKSKQYVGTKGPRSFHFATNLAGHIKLAGLWVNYVVVWLECQYWSLSTSVTVHQCPWAEYSPASQELSLIQHPVFCLCAIAMQCIALQCIAACRHSASWSGCSSHTPLQCLMNTVQCTVQCSALNCPVHCSAV